MVVFIFCGCFDLILLKDIGYVKHGCSLSILPLSVTHMGDQRNLALNY